MYFTIRRKLRVGLLLVAVAALAVAGCLGGSIEVGPVQFTANVGEGKVFQDLFLPKGAPAVSYREDMCEIPSESDLAEQYLQVGGVDVSNFIQLSRLELVEMKITATSGNFNFLSSISVRYIPAPVNGQEQDPVTLGTATNQNGLGTEISLVPPEPVDFLELIREDDANPSSECPKLEVEMTPRSIPLQDVEYTADVTIDAYARVGSV